MIRGDTAKYKIRPSEIRHSSFPLPVSVSRGLWTLGTTNLSCLGVHSIRKLWKWVFFLCWVYIWLLLKFSDGSFLTQYFCLLVRFTTSLITTLRLETSAAYRKLSGTKGHLGPGDSGYERHVLSLVEVNQAI